MKNDSENPGYVAYTKILRKLRRKVGVRNSTYSTQLLPLGKKLIGKSFKGVYAYDKLPLKKIASDEEAYYIINTDPSHKPGEHWVAVYQLGSKLYIYDSFGRESSKLLPGLLKRLKAKKFKYVDSDILDAEQPPSELSCGLRVLGIMLVIKHLGIEAALKV